MTETIPPRPFSDLFSDWLAYTSGRVKPTTLAAYANLADAYLLPEIGRFSPEELTGETLAPLLARLSRLAPATQNSVLNLLRAVLRDEHRGSLPLLPRARARRTEARTLSTGEQARLEAYLLDRAGPSELGILLSLRTGIRIGELCALQWNGLSLNRGTLTVSRTMQRIRIPGAQPHTKIVFCEPKSAHSARTIPLPQSLVDVLLPHRQTGDCYFTTGRADAFTEPRTMQYRFKAALRRAGVEDINFHALRHTFATRWIECGLDVKSLACILGHSNVSITLGLYAHPSMDSMRAGMDRLSSARAAASERAANDVRALP